MRLQWLQHVPFEGLGIIKNWVADKEAEISVTRLFADEILPDSDSFDLLIIMGGPMGISDHEEYPWLAAEKEFIRQAIDENKAVLGICLGAQLIADVLGARVYPGPQKEIGWFPIQRSDGAPDLLPQTLTAFHWHGDTFDIPEGAVHLASSDGCVNQGFVYKDRVIGLQFHMETTSESMEALIKNCSHELPAVDGASSSIQKEQDALIQSNGAGSSVYIQTAEQMRGGTINIPSANSTMCDLLNSIFR